MIRTSLCSVILLLGAAFGGRSETYVPEGGVRPSKGKVDIELVRLLSAQDVIGRNLSAEQLAAFIQRAEKSVAASIPAGAPAFRLRILVAVSPGARPKFDLSYDQAPPRKILQGVYDSLQKLPDTRSKKDVISFELDFVVKSKA